MDEKLEKYLSSMLLQLLQAISLSGKPHNVPDVVKKQIDIIREIYLAGCKAQAEASRVAVKKTLDANGCPAAGVAIMKALSQVEIKE